MPFWRRGGTRRRGSSIRPARIREVDHLVTEVMRERGYPMEDFDQRAADVSVDHPDVVENYRAGHATSLENEQDKPPPRIFAKPWCITGPSSWSSCRSRTRTSG